MHIIKFARADISSYVGFVITAGEQECTQNKQDFSVSVGGKRTIWSVCISSEVEVNSQAWDLQNILESSTSGINKNISQGYGRLIVSFFIFERFILLPVSRSQMK